MSDAIARRASEIAKQVCGGPPERCYGWKAKIYSAAWDAACIALGGDPARYRKPPKLPAPVGIEIIHQHSRQVGPVDITFTIGRITPSKGK